MRKWIRRLGAAVLVLAAVLGCGGGCTVGRTDQAGSRVVPLATPVPPVGQSVDVVGVWRVGVNGAPPDLLMTFWAGGVMGTSDPGYGAWRPRPGGAEGTWETPLVSLSISYVVVLVGDRLVGTGLVFDLASPGPPRPMQLAGSRLKIDPTAVGAIVPPHT